MDKIKSEIETLVCDKAAAFVTIFTGYEQDVKKKNHAEIFDSLDVVEIVMDVERKFNVKIPDDVFLDSNDDIFNITVGSLVDRLAAFVKEDLENR
jgi:acyl carrier protein